MAASDLANLFGLNNKQESMDTARIASFEPDTFKPIMAGPEVAQGVAAGLFNMGNAVFGAFDNKVKETSRDDTAYATNEFLNTLQTAASMATPDELPTVIQTFSQVLDENPSILQDKGRTALNELSAQVTKNKEIQATQELKYAELAQEAAKEQARNALEAAKIEATRQEQLVKASTAQKANTSQELKYTVDGLEKVHERQAKFWENNSSLIESIARDTFLTRYKSTPGASKESIRSTLDSILREIGAAYNITTSTENYEKTLNAVYNSIFNESVYNRVKETKSRELQDLDSELKRNVSTKLNDYINKNVYHIQGSDGTQLAISDGLKSIAGYLIDPETLTPEQKKVLADGQGAGFIDFLINLGVPPRFAEGYTRALAGTALVSNETYKTLFTGMQKAIQDAKDNVHTFNDDTRKEVVESFRKKLKDTVGDSNNNDLNDGLIDVFELLLHPQVNRELADLDKDITAILDEGRSKKDNFITTAAVDLAFGGKGPSTLNTLIAQNQNNLNNRLQALNDEELRFAKYFGKLEQSGSIYTSTVSDGPTTGPEVTEKLRGINMRSSDMQGVSSSPMVTTRGTFDYLMEHSQRFSNTVAQIDNLLPVGMDIYDLLAAEAFVTGIYQDGKTNVATAFGNNIALNKDLQNKIRRYQNAGNWAAILDSEEFNKAIYDSVAKENKKFRKKWGTLDPAQQIIDNLDEVSKKLYDGYSAEQKAAVKKNINTYEFLAKYRGELGIPRRKNTKYNLGNIQAEIRNNPMGNRYRRFRTLTQIVPVK